MKQKAFIYCSLLLSIFAFSILHAEWRPIGNNQKPQKPLIQIISHSPNEYIIEINLFGLDSSEIQVDNNVYQKIFLPEYFNGGETGKPELPIIIESLCLPEQAKVEISIIDSSIKTLQNYLIYPLQKVSPENIKKEFCIDKEFYRRNIFYPEKSAIVDNKGGVWRDLNVRTLRIYPVKYNPATKELKVYNRLVLKLKYTGENSGIVKKNISPEWDQIYRDKVLNYPLLSNSSLMTLTATGNAYKYLIITSDDFVSNIKPFADYKTRQGLLSKVYKLSQITTVKDNTAIRDFIKREFGNNPGIEYVLLVGDESLIPMAIYHDNEYNFDYVGDYAYTCTNLQGNSLSQGPSAFYASFGIGRISAISEAEVDNFVSKSIGYETNPPLDNNWTSNALFVAHRNQNSDLFETEKKKIAGWYSGFFSNIYGAYGGDGATNSTIKNAIESLGVGVINYRGHGAENRWDSWNGVESFTSDNAFNLSNGRKLPVVFSISCDNSRLDYSGNCLSEGFTKSRSGAVAVLGATRVTANAPNDYLDESIFSNLVSNNGRKRISIISNNATKTVLDNFCGNNTAEIQTLGGNDDSRDAKKNALYYLWLGDPALDMYTGAISQIPGVDVRDDGSSITVTAGIPCDICISGGINGTELYSLVSGASTNSVSTTIRPLYITISAHNFVPYNAITGGTLLSDETWMYNMHVLGDVMLPAGKTLTVKPGTTLIFNNNSSLVVNGSLNANGATFDFISGNSTYTNGIKLLAGSTASISNSKIKNAYRAIDLNQAYLNLSGCDITGCSSHGINMYDERSVANRSEIYACNIHDNTGTGIVLYYSSPIIQVNNIYNNYYGMGVADYSAPSLGYMGAYGYNHIYSNRSHGFSANRNSNPFLGENICITNGGHNKIENNTGYNLSVFGNSIVTAENNWWEYLSDNVTINTARFYVSSGSFDYYPPADPEDPARYYDQDPNLVPGTPLSQSSPEEKLFDKKFVSSTGAVSKGGINESQIASMGKDSLDVKAELKTPTGYDEKWPILKKLTYAKYLLLLNRDAESNQICKKIVESIPDSSLSYYALDILWQSGRKNRMEDFKDYLKLLKSTLDNKAAALMAEVIEARFNKENRIKLLDEMWDKIKRAGKKELSSKAKQDIQESILFSKLLYYLNDKKNVEKAKETVLEVDDLVGFGSHSSVEAHSLIGDIIPEKEILVKELKDSEESAAIEKPTEYSLSGNYPNPFNPSTRIDYMLPMTSKVELKVYDILGHEVATLVNTIQEAGRYSTIFNASNVSSGLYIYKISAHSLENGRVFEKTAKMMFLK
ncbi:MAG: T9SS type A sorting domain-containing protein [Ignavibacteria bacterium]|jgi:hypothetical protein|nr:T9SS type A sorting domain-containing protein [Ignavibacteria bacterium]MCU7521036.1 T9SS type A sorting domain-containing protein [Ignavibacteria bacterium]